ncbi:MAG TPA: carbamoyltransferase HypF [Anaerolineae bacterium]|nr:carbamoyltransferase HypF [Anaerolineae bacterium]
MTAALQRLKIEIHGAVQGVGFRPFVYRLAAELALTGWVVNNARGVFIEAEGPKAALETFLQRLSSDKPPLAMIQSLDAEWLAPVNFEDFQIRRSDAAGAKTVLVLPDAATCADCLREVFNPADRRYRYPFTNCTNCGPRFSIIQALPYDRPNTTMRRFTLCPTCQSEYENPLDRRFHAQPNACPVCGPNLEFQVSGFEFRVSHNPKLETKNLKPIDRAVAAIKAGEIVAVKGLGGFHLMVDAQNARATARLRQRKPRRDKPFAVMARNITQVRQVCEISPQAEALLTSTAAPIVLLPKKKHNAIAENVAPGNPNLGIMLPYTPLHHLLLQELDGPIVATSGNLSDEPICTDEDDAMQRLGHIADSFLIHNRPIARHVDDSVAWLLLDEPRLLRRARGYAPLPLTLSQEMPVILAVGAHLKNTIALSVGKQVFISQHIGNLESAEAIAAFQRVIADFLRLYEASPVAIAHDMHPDYFSTHWAREQRSGGVGEQGSKGAKESPLPPHSPTPPPLYPPTPRLPCIPVQHHHAHLAACLAENGEDGPALGVIWDGTGYGSDGVIWGGEFLRGDAADFERAAHLRPFRLPGGDAAVKEPRRVALALLWELYGEAALTQDHLAPIQSFTSTEKRLLGQMLKKPFNAPLTTSAGRLFDGVAALLSLHQQISFEGQAAMALEYLADKRVTDAYPLPPTKAKSKRQKAEGNKNSSFRLHPSSFILDWLPMLDALLQDLQAGVDAAVISARFHNGLIEAIVATAELIGEEKVALSGGCFQNRFLTEGATQQLRRAGFKVLLHRQVPPNDGGISLGQIAVAAARMGKKSF